MATPLQTIITRARRTLVESTASFWTDAELLDHAVLGCKDLWKAIIDVYADHFLVIDPLNVTLPASTFQAAGIPANCFRVKFIEPRDPTAIFNAFFLPKDYGHPEFAKLRTLASQDAQGTTFLYDLVGAGPPVATPTLYIAPKVSATLSLTLGYIQSISDELTTASFNPIPGETDHMLEAWTIAWARAKEREDRSPDPEWIKIYGDEKKGLLQAITPRQEDEPDYAEGLFEDQF